MAQLVEQRIRNAWVPGSSPGIGSFFVSVRFKERKKQSDTSRGISTSVVHRLPKPRRRVRLPYSAQRDTLTLELCF